MSASVRNCSALARFQNFGLYSCINARTYSSPQASRSKASIPSFVNDKIREMQIEIASQFICDVPPPNASYIPTATLPDTNEEFNENLARMAKYYFEQGGKMFRPTVSLLMANACNVAMSKTKQLECGNEEISINQYKIGMISEMIHTASLVHDDVIDGADTRRGNASVNAVWGNKMAVLVGDFILARATQVLCSIGRPQVISVMATIIEDLVMGEFMQMTAKSCLAKDRLSQYMEKTYKKTASLFANSCKSAAILAEGDEELQWRASEYGRHLGLAFQLVDDLLDVIATSSALGKPASADLKLGLATGPVIFASQQYPELEVLIQRKFNLDGDAEKAREIVLNSTGIEKTRQLAKMHSEEAAKLAAGLPNSEGVSDVLVDFALAQMNRES